jgi:hypothetical protein
VQRRCASEEADKCESNGLMKGKAGLEMPIKSNNALVDSKVETSGVGRGETF